MLDRRFFATAILAGVSFAAACGDDGTGTGGAGAAGAGGTVGGGGEGAGDACASPSDCPAPSGECKVATCVNGACGTDNVAQGTPTATGQVDGDCQERVCDGNGATSQANDDDDTEDDANECTEDTCEAGSPAHTPISGSCTEGGGSVCADPQGRKAGICVECNIDDDCPDGEVCDPSQSSNTCVDPSCADGTLNGTETDTDCGGDCGPCVNGDTCVDADDCQSGFCNGTVCSACSGPADCDPTEWCDSSANGGTCTPDLAGGDACGDASQCSSGFCTDGVCCDAVCDGLCEACTAALTGSGADGTCSPIDVGNDPDAECDSDAASSCGQTGECDGSGACELYDATTVCNAPTCSGGVANPLELCDGQGTCVDSGTVPCGLFTCDAAGLACNGTCASDTDCVATAFCDGTGACQPKLSNGGACGGPNQCTSGNCVDGVCCDGACGGTCQACNVAGSVGTCTSVPAGTDPINECAGAYSCNGATGCQACGDGVLQPNEQCDDGNTVSGDGCEPTCLFPNPWVQCLSPNLAINGAGPGINNPSIITLPALPGVVTDVNVTLIGTHTWPGDLDFRLIHNGVTSFIVDNPGVPASTFGCSTDNFNIILDDEGIGAIENVCNAAPPGLSGTHTPNQPLSAYDGQAPGGNWNIVIDDSFASGDNGVLQQWCVTVSYQ